MWSLLDADQDIPWQDQPITYYLKWRVYFQVRSWTTGIVFVDAERGFTQVLARYSCAWDIIADCMCVLSCVLYVHALKRCNTPRHVMPRHATRRRTIQEYDSGHHIAAHDVTWSIGGDTGEYDVPQCTPGTPVEQCTHAITGQSVIPACMMYVVAVVTS